MLVSEFLTNLKRRGQYQAASTVLSDTDYVSMANDQLRMVICPKIVSLRDNFFTGQKDYTLTASRRYRLPARILGGRISQVQIVNGSQNFNLQQMPNTDKPTSVRRGFYLTQGQIVLTGQIPSGTMRVIYGIRPPKMSTAASLARSVTSVQVANLTVTFGATGTFQVIRSGSPFRTITTSLTVTGGAPPSLGVDADSSDYTRFQVGDILITPDTTYIVPLEQQLCDWLLQRTHMRVLQALGQTDQLQAAGSKLADIQRDCMALMSPRVENSPKVIFGGQASGWNWRD